MPQEYDVIVVGAGHNGLVTAAYLAKAGLQVLVLEKRHIVGGACVTEEHFPGFKFSTFAYVCSLLQPHIIEEMELKKYGFDIRTLDPFAFNPLPDGRYLFEWLDQEKTAKEIENFSKRDAKAYLEFERWMERFDALVQPTLNMSAPDMFEVVSRSGSSQDEETFRKLMMMSAKDFLDELFESTEVKGWFAAISAVGTHAGPMSPGSVYIIFYHLMGRATGQRGLWGFVRGGMGAITQAMAQSAQAKGATIRTNAEIDKIVVKDGKATGAVLVGGEEIKAKAVVSNADPKRTFLKMLEPNYLEGDFRKRIENIKMEGTSFKVLLALDGLPEFTCLPGSPGPQHMGFMNICPSMDYIERAWDDCKYGRPSEKPFLNSGIQSLTEPDLAPPGKHTMYMFVQYAPYHLKDTTWEEERDKFGKRCIETFAEYTPNLKDIIIDYKFISPWDIENTIGMTGGHIFHGDILPDQSFSLRYLSGWSDYRTPIRSLYLCGSGTHPGGCVFGAPGYNAANEIIKDWKEGSIER